MSRPLLFVESASGVITAAYIPAHRDSANVLSWSVAGPQLAAESGEFLRNCRKARPVVVGLVPRSQVLMSYLRLPTTNADEARSIALLQFVRSTPHSREELIVDAILAKAEQKSGWFVCAAVTLVSLEPLIAALAGAGLRADHVSVGIAWANMRGMAEGGRDALVHAKTQPWDRAQWIELAQAFDRCEIVLDLRTMADRREGAVRLARHHLIHMGIVLGAAFILWVAAEGIQVRNKLNQLSFLSRELAQVSPEVDGLVHRRGQVEAFRKALGQRMLFRPVAEAIASSVPEGIRLNELSLARDQSVVLKGSAAKIDEVKAWRDALAVQGVCVSVEIKSLDKRPTEPGEITTFVLSCPKKEGG